MNKILLIISTLFISTTYASSPAYKENEVYLLSSVIFVLPILLFLPIMIILFIKKPAKKAIILNLFVIGALSYLALWLFLEKLINIFHAENWWGVYLVILPSFAYFGYAFKYKKSNN